MSSFGSAMELDKYRALEQEILTLPLQALLTSEIEISDKNLSGIYSDDWNYLYIINSTQSLYVEIHN